MRTMISTLLVALSLSACQPSAPPMAKPVAAAAGPPSAILTVASPTQQDRLAVRVSAPAAHPIHIVNCNGDVGWRLQVARDEAWQEIWSGETDACFSPPIRIAAGESQTFTVARYFAALGELPEGDYRIVLHAMYRRVDANTPDAAQQIAEPQRSSNTFRLDIPQE